MKSPPFMFSPGPLRKVTAHSRLGCYQQRPTASDGISERTLSGPVRLRSNTGAEKQKKLCKSFQARTTKLGRRE
jgi:hypothetical protein